MAFKFTSNECDIAANQLRASTNRIEQIVSDFETEIESVNQNYQSESATAIVASINKVKGVIPTFREAVEDCAKYLQETVKPAYEKLEATAKQKIES